MWPRFNNSSRLWWRLVFQVMTPQAVFLWSKNGPKQSIVVINHWLNVILLIILNLYMSTAGMQFKKTAKCFTSPCFVMLCDWHLVSQNHMFAYVNLCDLNFYTLCSFLINTLRMFPRVGEHTHTHITWLNRCIALQICILPRANNFDSNQLTKQWRTVECSLLKSFFIPVRTRKFWECIGIL